MVEPVRSWAKWARWWAYGFDGERHWIVFWRVDVRLPW